MLLRYCKELYSKTALLKAAYHFTRDYYVFLDQDQSNYIVDISPKAGSDISLIKGLFSNELLAQVTREEVVRQTQHIRELVLGRAFASTIIEDAPDKGDNLPLQNLPPVSADANDADIFTDWFERYDK